MELRQLIARLAKTDVAVLILGENGTGKELIAKSIHEGSTRKGKPFVSLNCAAVPSELIESELFGHEKGAFTGAVDRRAGRFEQAEGGTLFLDEIGDMPLALQPKLLRVLQEREFERVGGRATVKTNVRVLTATNKDLLTSAKHGKFRQDLYYRIAVFPVQSPPLRERATDIPFLANAFLQESSRPTLTLAPAASAVLSLHKFPGNVRELRNVIERLVIMTNSEEVSVTEAQQALNLDHQYRLDEKEKTDDLVVLQRVVHELAQTVKYHTTKAEFVENPIIAESIGIRPGTLVQREEQYGLVVELDGPNMLVTLTNARGVPTSLDKPEHDMWAAEDVISLRRPQRAIAP